HGIGSSRLGDRGEIRRIEEAGELRFRKHHEVGGGCAGRDRIERALQVVGCVAVATGELQFYE
ncbi:hypothetical protein, partial [Burkholderia sp. BE12]|uniref:hypothetical protein n=1 Tax=Burkholderia sp. BE12 TaxID=2082394 RepID=UPI001F2B42EA